MFKKKIVSLLIMAVVISLSTVVHVNAETPIAKALGSNLVDSGNHMDYAYSTKYDGYIWGASNTWNDYLGTVIREDSFGTIKDCSITDVTRSDVLWAGVTNLSAGTIQLNTYHMDTFSTTKIALVIKHEFGHTLGCNENDCSTLNIMYPTISYSNINLTIHDKASVDLAKLSW